MDHKNDNPLAKYVTKEVGKRGPKGGKPLRDPRTKEAVIVPAEKRRRMLEFTADLLHSKGRNVVEKLLKVALDDSHPHQIQALKLCLDRIAPASFFEDAHKKAENSKIEVNVVISDPRASVPATYDAETVEDVEEIVPEGATQTERSDG